MAFKIKIPVDLLPIASKLKSGQKIDWGKKSLKEKSFEEKTIDLAEELSIQAHEVFKYVSVSLGEIVEKGKVLAKKKGLINSKTVKAPSKCEVRSIDHTDGTLKIAIEEEVDVPFNLEAKFIDKSDGNYIFEVNKGLQTILEFSMEKTFGGECSYIEKESEILPENVENKVVVTSLKKGMDLAKIWALGPIAIVSSESSYYHSELSLALLKEKPDFKQIVKDKWKKAIYFLNSKTIYFYNP